MGALAEALGPGALGLAATGRVSIVPVGPDFVAAVRGGRPVKFASAPAQDAPREVGQLVPDQLSTRYYWNRFDLEGRAIGTREVLEEEVEPLVLRLVDPRLLGSPQWPQWVRGDGTVLDAVPGRMSAALSRLRAAHDLLLRSREASIELTGRELGDFPDTPEGLKELRAAAREHLKALRGRWVDCPALGRKVEIRKRGIDKMLAMSGDPVKLRLMPAIEQIIRVGTNPQRQENFKRERKGSALAYHLLSGKATVGGAAVRVAVLIEEDVHGFLHYDLLLNRPEKAEAAKDRSSAASLPPSIPGNNPGDSDERSMGESGGDVNGQVFDSAGPDGVINLFIIGQDAIPVLDSAVGVLDKAGDAGGARTMMQRAALAARLQAATKAYASAAGGVARLRAVELVRNLLREMGAGSVEPPHVETLRAIAQGKRDTERLAELYGLIQEAVGALEEAGALAGEAENLAHAAITRWAELEEKANG